MNAKISVFVICVEAMIYLLLYNFHDCTFKQNLKSVGHLRLPYNEHYNEKHKLTFIFKLVEEILSSFSNVFLLINKKRQYIHTISGKQKIVHNHQYSRKMKYFLQFIATEIFIASVIVTSKKKKKLDSPFCMNNGSYVSYVCVSGGQKYSFFGKFGVVRFLETPVLRFALLPYCRQTVSMLQSHYNKETQF